MDKALDSIEFEMMLLGRYSLSERRGAAHRLDRSAYTLLSRLSAEGPMTIGQLSDAMNLNQSTLNRQTTAMMKNSVVERIPDPEGGIARKFRITDAGQRALERDRAGSIHALNAILADWPDADVAAFAENLRRFNASIEAYIGRPWPRSETAPDAH
ncbi:MarR family winged helix-turn-helix transcriptional regulator [Nocardia sp. NPDC050712]|uniref:MarR family winged helix-turn-helix transcriptional regulator n=1 Tax=Nocardia sp. NPDC050712 TaxID=3155518 RepID=UPI00340D358F